MSKILKSNVWVFIALLSFSCENPDAEPVVTFESAIKGAYPRLISEGNTLMNLYALDTCEYVYSIEFSDAEHGALVDQYILMLEYDTDDADKAYGPAEFRTFSSDDFLLNDDGYMGITDISLSSGDLLEAAGLEESDLNPWENFIITSKLILKDGSEYTSDNSSSTISSSAFRGHFDYSLPINCYSDLTGTFSYSSEVWCGKTYTGTVKIEAVSDWVYTFSDWSFGGYLSCNVYESGVSDSDKVASGLEFTETCGVIEFTTLEDSEGDVWEITSSIDGEEWTITYNNSAYGETGTAVIIWPGGVPFTLAD